MTLSIFTHASEVSSPELRDANLLLHISPEDAQIAIKHYLKDKPLYNMVGNSPSSVNHGDRNSEFRSPKSTVEALEILAQAEFKLGQKQTALSTLKQAIGIANHYQLSLVADQVEVLKIKLQWLLDHNTSQAREHLRQLLEKLQAIKNSQLLTSNIQYDIIMLRAQIASYENDLELTALLFKTAKSYLSHVSNMTQKIDYHITIGHHYLTHERYNSALSELLIAYWSAVDTNASAQLAKTNVLLARLFETRKIYDRALIYLSQAADFYDNYPDSPTLQRVLTKMGDIYYHQGKYNLALVHYLNVIDHEKTQNNIRQQINTELDLSATYLELYNYPLAEEYLNTAKRELAGTQFTDLNTKASLLSAQLSFHRGQISAAKPLAEQTLALAQQTHNQEIEQKTNQLLSSIYEKTRRYQLALKHTKRAVQLAQAQQHKLNQLSEDEFVQQKNFVEQTLHLEGQDQSLKDSKKNLRKLQIITFSLFFVALILFLILLRRGYIIRRQNDEIDQINQLLFTHSRSKLNNLRMLNANLPKSLYQSSRTYEQWHIGELIHEPLSDRLRFAMIDIPFLRNMYLEHGYTAGLELEQAFGAYLKQKLTNNTRLFHFSDANLIYIEDNLDRDTPPEALFDKFKQWVDEFQPSRELNRVIRLGIADYPFLPKAYTAINDKELLDILLMATSASRQLSMKEKTSQWVYLKAIDNAPAASFAADDVRKSCQQAINQGLVKVYSSHQSEDGIKKLLKNE